MQSCPSNSARGLFKENIMTTKQIAEALAGFATNLENSITMEDRRNSVQWLAEKIGSHAANQIRNIYGLAGDYYKA
jgi:hypothetical protein